MKCIFQKGKWKVFHKKCLPLIKKVYIQSLRMGCIYMKTCWMPHATEKERTVLWRGSIIFFLREYSLWISCIRDYMFMPTSVSICSTFISYNIISIIIICTSHIYRQPAKEHLYTLLEELRPSINYVVLFHKKMEKP